MNTFINQKEKYNKKRKISNFFLTFYHKNTLELNRANGSSFYLEKPKKSFFNEKDSLLKKISSQNKILSLNNTFYNKSIKSNKSLDLPFNIRLLYNCKKYLHSLDNEIVKGRQQLNKIKKITKTNYAISLVSNNINNGKEFKTFYKHNGLSEKSNLNKLNKKLTMINFNKSKELNLNNIRSFKYNNNNEKLKNNSKLLLKEKKSNNLSEYSTAKNKQKRIFEFKNNVINNLSTTMKGSLSTSNINNKINQSNNLLHLNNISKEESRTIYNNSSIDKKQTILLYPIKNIKALSSVNNTNKINKISNTKDIIIPELPTKKSNNDIKEKETSNNEQQKNNLNLRLDDNNNIKNIHQQLPMKENINTNNINNIIIPLNKINIQLRKSANNTYDEKIYKRIFNSNINKMNNVSTVDKEGKKEKEIGNNDNVNQINNNINTKKDNNEINVDNKGDFTFKRIFQNKKRTKLLNVFPSNKKLNNNIFLEKIKTLNIKYQNKDEIMTHQIKLNKKSIIEKQSRKITKIPKRQNTVINFETGYTQEINIIKDEYIENAIYNQQDLDNLINNNDPEGINNKIKNGGFTVDLVRYIFRSNHFSSVFLPLVDISQKRKSFMEIGKLYIINNEIKVFQDKKTKFVEKKSIIDEKYQEDIIPFISKELINLSDISFSNKDFLKLEKIQARKNNNINTPSPKRNLTNNSISRIRRARNISKKTMIEKLTLTPSMIKRGIKPISILNKEEFFEVRKKEKNNIDNRKRRRKGIIDPFSLKSLSHKPLDYIRRMKHYNDKEDYFFILKNLIRKGKVALFFEYFQENLKNFYINKRDEDGNTLLILATKQGLNTICKLLIKNGVDVNIRNDSGNSALHYALSGKNFVIADELRIYGASENCKNKRGFTPWECLGKNIDD